MYIQLKCNQQKCETKLQCGTKTFIAVLSTFRQERKLRYNNECVSQTKLSFASAI